MSDLVINVKQVSNYPTRVASDGTETMLVQVGGLGGPYQSINSAVLVQTALAGGGPLGIGQWTPAYAVGPQIFTDTFVVPNGGTLAWNAYVANGGVWRTWRAGAAARLGFAPADGFDLSITPSGTPSGVLTWITQLRLDQAGAMRLLNNTLTVARDPSAPMEVATSRWVRNNTVGNFMGRTGAVRLEAKDVYRALALQSPLATEDTVLAKIQELLAGHPFVWSVNARTGNVWIGTEDINRAFFCEGVWPLAPTAPAGDRSDRIANTRWVVDFAYGPFWRQVEDFFATKVGPEGPAGPQGPTGTGFRFRGTVATAADLPATGNAEGDLFIAQDTNTGYVWDSASDSWQQIGIISPSARVFVSPTPPVVAENGDLWWSSTDGELAVYYSGPSGGAWVMANTGMEGPAGPPGAPGIPGTPGLPGPNVWIGANPPPSPTVGRLWYDPGSGNTAVYTGTQWVPVMTAGATVSTGTSPPANPADGDLWFDANDGDLLVWYVGPSGGQWVTVSVGPQGPAGPPGATGPVGPEGPQGVRGEPGQGINLLGSVTTFGALPATGQQNGDAWVTQDTNQLWVWDGTAWELIGVGGGIGEAPTDGRIYGRQNLDWEALMDDGAY